MRSTSSIRDIESDDARCCGLFLRAARFLLTGIGVCATLKCKYYTIKSDSKFRHTAVRWSETNDGRPRNGSGHISSGEKGRAREREREICIYV